MASTPIKASAATSFPDIPPEILRRIFFNLDPKQRQLLRSLCRNCKIAVDLYYGIRVEFTNENLADMLLHDRHCYKEISFKNLTTPLDLSRGKIRHSILPGIEKAEFHGLVTPHNLSAVLTHCRHLESITFTENVINDSDIQTFSQLLDNLTLSTINFPLLTALKIVYYRDGGVRDDSENNQFQIRIPEEDIDDDDDDNSFQEMLFDNIVNTIAVLAITDAPNPQANEIAAIPENNAVIQENNTVIPENNALNPLLAAQDIIPGNEGVVVPFIGNPEPHLPGPVPLAVGIPRTSETSVHLFKIIRRIFQIVALNSIDVESDENSLLIVLEGLFSPTDHLIDPWMPAIFEDPLTSHSFRYLCEEDKIIYQIIQDNLQSLRSVSINEKMPFSPIFNLSMELHDPPSTVTLIDQVRSYPNISELTCALPDNGQCHWALTIVPRLIQYLGIHQTEVNSLKLASGYYNLFFLGNTNAGGSWESCWPIFESFERTLRIFHFYYYNTRADIAFDDLEECTALKELVIAQDETPWTTNYPNNATIRSFHSLPLCVTILKISAPIYFNSNDFNEISFANWRNLEEFEWYSKPWFTLMYAHIYEMKIEYLDHIFHYLTKLRRLCLRKSKYYSVPHYQNFTFDTIPAELINELRTRAEFRTQIFDEIIEVKISRGK